MVISVVFVASGVSILLAMIGEMFPAGIRAVGFGMPYSLAVALFGGTAPYLQTFFDQHHNTSLLPMVDLAARRLGGPHAADPRDPRPAARHRTRPPRWQRQPGAPDRPTSKRTCVGVGAPRADRRRRCQHRQDHRVYPWSCAARPARLTESPVARDQAPARPPGHPGHPPHPARSPPAPARRASGTPRPSTPSPTWPRTQPDLRNWRLDPRPMADRERPALGA
jgi:hypothetical protein